MEWFKFNDVKSDDLEIVVKEMPPVTIAPRDIESIKVTGSDRQLHIDKGSYSAYEMTISIILMDSTKLDQIKKTYHGTGKLILSTQPDRYFNATVMNQVDFSKYYSVLREAPLQFEVDPIAFSNQKKTFVAENSTEMTVDGTAHTFPVIKVTGTGSFAINHNSVIVNESGVTIDCKNMTVTNNGVNKADKVELVNMDFPYLIPGQNPITMTGITKLEIEYEEGWL